MISYIRELLDTISKEDRAVMQGLAHKFRMHIQGDPSIMNQDEVIQGFWAGMAAKMSASSTEYSSVLVNALRMDPEARASLVSQLIVRGTRTPTDPIDSSVLVTAINEWGPDAQLNIVIEELLELAVELQKLKRHMDKNDLDGIEARHDRIRDEVADVMICMRTAGILFGVSKIDERIKYKIDRLRRRLEMERKPPTQ